MIEPGDTFDGFDHRRHLYIVLSAQTATADVALVGLTSHYPERVQHDEHCVVIGPHEHPWIRRDSCVFLPVAAMEGVAQLELGLSTGELQQHPSCSAGLLKRIQAAVLSEQSLPADMRVAIRAVMELNPLPTTTP